ncbi:MAG: thioredoxin family protein [Nitrososphaeraceae archaeon]
MSLDITREIEWNTLVLDKNLVAADFWAPWCPYCMRLKPIFESIASRFPEIRFVKINVEEQQELASRYGIRGIPVIKFFCEEKEVGEIVGYLPQVELEKKVIEIGNGAHACLANTSLMR